MPGLHPDPIEWGWMAHGMSEGEILNRRRERYHLTEHDLADADGGWSADAIVDVERLHSVPQDDVERYMRAIDTARVRLGR